MHGADINFSSRMFPLLGDKKHRKSRMIHSEVCFVRVLTELCRYCIVARGLSLGIAGTSASAPVVSAIFAKLNGVRIAAGKPPLGFLNPFIYQNMDSFNDVTHGSNGCAPFTKGFKATTGWVRICDVKLSPS